MGVKKFSRRDFLRMSALSAAGAALAGCACPTPTPETIVVTSESGETVVVTSPPEQVMVTAEPPAMEAQNLVWMQMPGEVQAGYESEEEALQAFTDKYGHTVERVDRDDARVSAMIAAGQPLDLVRIIGLRMRLWATRGLALDLTDYFDTSDVIDVDDLLPVNDLYVLNERRYGAIKDWSADLSFWINTKMWEDAGVPVPEAGEMLDLRTLREYSTQLSQSDGDVQTVIGTLMFGSMTCLGYIPLTFENSRGLFEDDATKINISGDEEIMEVLEWYVDWEKEGVINSPINPTVTGGNPNQDFVAGAGASIQRGFWFGSQIANATEIDPEDVMLLPAPGWGPNYASPCAYGCGNFIPRHTKVGDAAWQLFQWFIAEEPATKRVELGWGLPAFASQMDALPTDPPWRAQAKEAVMHDLENSVAPLVPTSKYTDLFAIRGAWNARLESLLKEEITLDEAVAGTEEEVNQQIQDVLDGLGIS